MCFSHYLLIPPKEKLAKVFPKSPNGLKGDHWRKKCSEDIFWILFLSPATLLCQLRSAVHTILNK